MNHRFGKLNNNFQGIILAIIGFSAFAMADANAKFLTESYVPAHIVGLVAIFSSSICLLLSPLLGGFKQTFQTKKLKIHALRGLMNAGAALLVVSSFVKFSLAGTYTILFLAPFVVSLLAIPIFKEQVNKHGWIAIAGGFIGVLVVIRPGLESFNPHILIPLTAVLFIAGLFLSARPLGKNETLVSLAFFPVLANLILITPVVLLVYGFPELHDLPHFIMQGMLVICGLTFTALAFRIAKASVVSPFIYCEIIWAIGFDYFLFEDRPDLWTFIGAAIIIASGIYLIETERRIS